VKSQASHGPDSEIKPAEKRTSVRIQTDDPAFLHILNPVSANRLDIGVLDVSERGMKLLVGQFLLRGTTVQVRLKETVAKGEVRYCVPAKEGFHVGVLIEDVFYIPQSNSK